MYDLSAMCYPVIFYRLHLYVFVLICQYYVVLLERTNKDIIYIVRKNINIYKIRIKYSIENVIKKHQLSNSIQTKLFSRCINIITKLTIHMSNCYLL